MARWGAVVGEKGGQRCEATRRLFCKELVPFGVGAAGGFPQNLHRPCLAQYVFLANTNAVARLLRTCDPAV
jgi:hypothetical protein